MFCYLVLNWKCRFALQRHLLIICNTSLFYHIFLNGNDVTSVIIIVVNNKDTVVSKSPRMVLFKVTKNLSCEL